MWPQFDEEIVSAVAKVLRSGKVNSWTGNQVTSFEGEFAAFVNCNHAIAVANGTVALDLSFYGLGIGERNLGRSTDEVIVTSRSFMASASSIVNAGAIPVFVDIDAETQNFDPEKILLALTKNTKAILCVHLAGWPCDIDAIKKVISGRDIKIIEDCAQAHGALYKGNSVGSLGDVAAWSFCQDKIMSTGGEGGMVTCHNESLKRRMWAYKDHGKSYEAVYEKEHAPGFRWLHESFGTNWRLTEMQAAIGRIQLKRMLKWKLDRTKNAKILTQAFEPYSYDQGPIRIPRPKCVGCTECDTTSGCSHAWYKYYVFVRPENLPEKWTRDRIIDLINSRGISCTQGSCSEMYLEKAFDNTSLRPKERLPVAKKLGETSLMFLVHPTLTDGNMQETFNVVTEVMQMILADM